METYKFYLYRPYRSATLSAAAVPSHEREVVVTADSCCEAQVLAIKKHPEYVVTSYEFIKKDEVKKTPEELAIEARDKKILAEYYAKLEAEKKAKETAKTEENV